MRIKKSSDLLLIFSTRARKSRRFLFQRTLSTAKPWYTRGSLRAFRFSSIYALKVLNLPTKRIEPRLDRAQRPVVIELILQNGSALSPLWIFSQRKFLRVPLRQKFDLMKGPNVLEKITLQKQSLASIYFLQCGGSTEANAIEERRPSTILMHFLCAEFHSAVSALKIPLKLYSSQRGTAEWRNLPTKNVLTIGLAVSAISCRADSPQQFARKLKYF